MMLMKVRVKYQLPERFMLTVGSIEKRKNALLIIQALKNIKENIPLVLIGKPTEYVNEIKQYLMKNNLEHRVIFLHNISFDELPIFYHAASVFIYPSRFEGFGIPIIEALQCGVPVIAATGSCLEEAGGPNSIYVNPDDVEDMANAINLVLEGDNSERISAGKNYATRFTHKNIARNIMDVYLELIKK